jgi:hypothetical protein
MITRKINQSYISGVGCCCRWSVLVHGRGSGLKGASMHPPSRRLPSLLFRTFRAHHHADSRLRRNMIVRVSSLQSLPLLPISLFLHATFLSLVSTLSHVLPLGDVSAVRGADPEGATRLHRLCWSCVS